MGFSPGLVYNSMQKDLGPNIAPEYTGVCRGGMAYLRARVASVNFLSMAQARLTLSSLTQPASKPVHTRVQHAGAWDEV